MTHLVMWIAQWAGIIFSGMTLHKICGEDVFALIDCLHLVC
jgi:hypothetical protein